MIKTRIIYYLLFLLGFGGLCVAGDIGTSRTGSGDIESCAADLNDLQLVVRDAANQADSSTAKHEHTEHCGEESTHKDLGVGDCDDIGQGYQDDLTDLDLELKNLENQLKKVQRSCGYDFVLTISK